MPVMNLNPPSNSSQKNSPVEVKQTMYTMVYYH